MFEVVRLKVLKEEEIWNKFVEMMIGILGFLGEER